MFPDIFSLSGKTALVTGGSRGLGKAIARVYAEAGADIMICSRSEEELRPAAAEIGAGLPARVEWMVVDMTDRAQVDGLAAETLSRLGRVDVLVNNAGANVPQPIDEIVDDVWDRVVELNLSSCMRLTRSLVPQMKQRQWGRVIHISSILGLGGKEGRNAYCSTKAALLGLTRASAIDLAPHNITVNAISPGPFLTDLPGRVLTAAQKEQFKERTAIGRWGRPEEIAGTALLLATEAGSYITGTVIVVDGGVLAKIL